MALAILGVLFVHSGIILPHKQLQIFVGMGYGGVDLFFFLSGFGLFFSCDKNCECRQFWWKRIKRIMPSYMVCLIIADLITRGTVNWTSFWHNCTFLGYWIKSLNWSNGTWFLSAIMGLYLIFPFYFRIFKKYPKGATIHAALVGIILAELYYFILRDHSCNTYIHFFARAPIFFLGVYAGLLYKREKNGEYEMNKMTIMTILLLPYLGYQLFTVIVSFGISYINLKNSGGIFYPFLFITPGLALAAGYVIDKSPVFAKKVMAIIGNSTLEAYCLLSCVYTFRTNFTKFTTGNITGCLLMMLSCIVLACIVHYGVSFIIKLFGKLQLYHRAKTII